jgi:hypothetical protein
VTVTVKKVIPRLLVERCMKRGCEGRIVTGKNGHGVCIDCGPLEMLPKSALQELSIEQVRARGPRTRPPTVPTS